ncbi:MAG: hypothetical protein IT405_00390 [Candidatus Yanofskybacteria bacterium]|nr:hypothetical protein [Candidatus Yanofskybacteria bacterium]
MHRDLVERIVRMSVPQKPEPLARATPHGRMSVQRHARRRSSTTIIGLRYADGILCVADRKMSGYWFRIMSMDFQKIYTVSPISVLMGSGSVVSLQQAERYVRRTAKQFLMQAKVPMSTEGQAALLAEWCELQFMWLGEWFSFFGILAGFDTDGTSHLYAIEQDGCKIEEAQYYATGSGGFEATAVLDQRWEKDMNLAHALHIGVDAQYQAGCRDSGSSDVRLAIPSAAAITKDGVQPISEAYVLQALASVLALKPSKPLKTALALAVAGLS